MGALAGIHAGENGNSDEPGRRTQKAFGPVNYQDPVTASPAEIGGVNVDAGNAVDGRDRRRLEQLCRYMARPPLCQERLTRNVDGKLVYSFKKPWKDGTRAIMLSPLDFLARLCAIIPPPRFHVTHYHGVFASGSAIRQAVVPGQAEATGAKYRSRCSNRNGSHPPPRPLATRGPGYCDACGPWKS